VALDLGTPAIRADGLATERQAGSVFVRHGSARVFVSAAIVAVAARLVVGDLGLGDVVVSAITLVLIGPMEWLLHREVLHAPEDSWSSRRLGTGSGHRRHHEDPPDLGWLLVSGFDSVVVVVVFGALTAGWTSVVALGSGTAIIGPFLTGCALAAFGLAHYEWVHLLIHTRYRCRTRYYRRLAANHRRHHYRNERFWLGVTTNSGDRLFGTMPRSQVPISATARTLDESS
jgi:hypothetical protein